MFPARDRARMRGRWSSRRWQRWVRPVASAPLGRPAAHSEAVERTQLRKPGARPPLRRPGIPGVMAPPGAGDVTCTPWGMRLAISLRRRILRPAPRPARPRLSAPPGPRGHCSSCAGGPSTGLMIGPFQPFPGIHPERTNRSLGADSRRRGSGVVHCSGICGLTFLVAEIRPMPAFHGCLRSRCRSEENRVSSP